MERLIDGRPEAELLRIAQREIRKKTTPSRVLNEMAERKTTRFAFSELSIGEEIGRGGFCVLHDVTEISPDPNNLPILEEELSSSTSTSMLGSFRRTMGLALVAMGQSRQNVSHEVKKSTKNGEENHANAEDQGDAESFVQDREFMASHCTDDEKQPRYVIKTIQSSAREKAESFIQSVIDLALEARYLAVLRHPHIIRMRAMASAPPFEEGQTFFIILDKLSAILSTRLESWKTRMPSYSCLSSCCFPTSESSEFWIERLLVAYFLSTALLYLHGENIVYRDLKPDNVGFDARGDVKLFDFGLVRELQRKVLTTEGTFLLTGGTGFPPYMAPEVALHKPYNETCDVYSFCILLWQILKVEEPFGDDLRDDYFLNGVVKGGDRPSIKSKWSNELKRCMEVGWGDKITDRPSMAHVAKILEEEILDETGVRNHDSLLQLSRLNSQQYNT
ncbi:hypothetical protein ACA910_016887 [Epithemia clementina (nom. ined.)]